jgi:hypothetical protein
MALADAGALWKLAFCAINAGIRRSNIAAHIASKPTNTRIEVFKMVLTSYPQFLLSTSSPTLSDYTSRGVLEQLRAALLKLCSRARDSPW